MKIRDMTKGIALERLVLGNSKQLFLKGNHNTSAYLGSEYYGTASEAPLSGISSGTHASKWKRAAEKINKDLNPEEDPSVLKNGKGCCQKAICWWEPKLPSLTAEFCLESSMHGLQFVAQPKRHLSERIFWLIMFIGGIAAAVVLINSVWERYNKNPVIVSFNPIETDIVNIPFPAVTVCNINKFPRSLFEQISKIAFSDKSTDEEADKAFEELQYINSACTLQDSFAKMLNFAAYRGDLDAEIGNETLKATGASEALLEFLLTKTLPCDQLIRHCLWAENPIPCGKIFKPLVTDYGKCCAFNAYPIPLLLKNVRKSRREAYSDEDLREWSKWNYDDGILIDSKKNLTYPYRQKRAGMPYGLSFLIDPRTKDYFCPASDSNGVRFMLHGQLEIPHISDFGSVIGMGNEVFVEMQPDVTLANNEIKDFDSKTRHCLYGTEKSLEFYNAYSVGNCQDECSSDIMAEKCNCSYYYMPRREDTQVCNTQPDSAHRRCIQKAKVDMLSTLEKTCGHCSTLCEDVAYNFETTTSTLQNPDIVWGDHVNKTKPEWRNNELALVHVYFGSDSTVPKIRQKLYGMTDLIANTGGLLGLCLGFSALSLVEVVYFLTLRLFWQKIRRQFVGKRIANNLMMKFGKQSTPKKVIKPKSKQKNSDTEIQTFRTPETSMNPRNQGMQLDRQLLPLYPAYMNGRENNNGHQHQPNGNFGYSHGHDYRNEATNSPWYHYP